MPLFLVPPPQRIRITRRNFAVAPGLTARLDPLVAAEVEPVLSVMRSLFPELQVTRKLDVPAALTLDPLDSDTESEAILRLEVDETGITLAALGAEGWLRGAVLLSQLTDAGSIFGVSIQDWATFARREFHLSRSPADMATGFWEGLLSNLSRCGFNGLTFAGTANEGSLLPLRSAAARWGIRVTVGAGPPRDAPRLVESAEQGYPRATVLEEIHRAAIAALEEGANAWGVDAGLLGEETFLAGFWPALYFAGSCAWNPRKTEARAIRRTFAARFLGTDAADSPALLEEMEAAAAAGDGMLGDLASPFAAMFREDPFHPELRRQALDIAGRARDAREHARAVLDLLGEEQDRETANRREGESARDQEPTTFVLPLRRLAVSPLRRLASLEWPFRRLEAETEYLLGLEQVRDIYAEAFLSSGHARAAAPRLRTAAETLEGLANRIEELDGHLVRLWAIERAGDPAPALRALYAERMSRLRDKATELRGERDRYIQTGTLTSPETMGLEREGDRMGRAVLPGRLPPQHSPAWWPEGGFARVRVDVRSPHSGLPWEVIVNLRALSGEEGAFNIGEARLVRFDPETGAVGAVVPSQLTRGGLVFVTEAGLSVYYLYLDPRGGERARGETGSPVPPSRARARSPKEGVILENGSLALRIERTQGTVDRCQARLREEDEPEDLLSPEPGADDILFELTGAAGETAARVRVLENGPLLARVQAESKEGRVRQYDLYAGARWCEFVTNTSVPRIRHVFRPDPWRGGRAMLPVADGGEKVAGLEEPHEVTGNWAGRARPDGLTLAVLCPDRPARHILTMGSHTIEGEPYLSHVVLWCGAADGIEPISGLLSALQQPPVVQLGVVEERRAREF